MSKLEDLFPLGFGGASLSGEGGGYGFGEMTEKKAQELISFVYDQGIRVFDLAPIYGFGLAEERVGRAFKKKDREKVYLIVSLG